MAKETKTIVVSLRIEEVTYSNGECLSGKRRESTQLTCFSVGSLLYLLNMMQKLEQDMYVHYTKGKITPLKVK